MRRTAATLLAEAGASIMVLKLLGDWKSDTVAQGYIENSTRLKRNIADMLGSDMTVTTSSGVQNSTSSNDQVAQKRPKITTENSDINNISNNNSNIYNYYISGNFTNSNINVGDVNALSQQRKEKLILRLGRK